MYLLYKHILSCISSQYGQVYSRPLLSVHLELTFQMMAFYQVYLQPCVNCSSKHSADSKY